MNSRRIYNGVNRRISPIEHNNTQNPIIRTVYGSTTISASATAGVSISEIVSRVKAAFGIEVAKNATRSNSRQITIQPGKMFYITFTPKMVEVKGRQLHSISHGTSKWENFTANLPCTINREADGNIYYITK